MNQPSAGGVLSLTITDRTALHAAYMPYLQYGGLFVAVEHNCSMGDEVILMLELPDEPGKIPLSGTVVWITPRRAQINHRTAGIGVGFGEDAAPLIARIEKLLDTGPRSVSPTQTM